MFDELGGMYGLYNLWDKKKDYNELLFQKQFF